MKSITLRKVPENVTERIREFSERERRSINSEFLVIIEEGLEAHSAELDNTVPRAHISRAAQIAAWKDLAGKWKDKRPATEIVEDIRHARTAGREVKL